MLVPIILATLSLASRTVLASYDKPNYNVENADILFNDFVKEHNKLYNQKEYSERLEIFKQSLKDINERNIKFPNTVFSVNHFADLKPQELQQYFGFKLPNKNITEGVLERSQVTVSDAFDWRDKNAVTPVKKQGKCGASNIFSAVGNIEGQYAIKHGQCLAFSEGQALDCLKLGTCDGGTDMGVLLQELVEGKKKLEQAKDYPYVPFKKTCTEDANKGIVQVIDVYEMLYTDEDKIKTKLSLYGPLSIAIDGSDFPHYKGGILEPKVCNTALNIAVLLVGYGEENGKKFWILKNSWGTGWGEEGYARMLRGVSACGIGSYIVASIVASPIGTLLTSFT